jgi:hypothetical protein
MHRNRPRQPEDDDQSAINSNQSENHDKFDPIIEAETRVYTTGDFTVLFDELDGPESELMNMGVVFEREQVGAWEEKYGPAPHCGCSRNSRYSDAPLPAADGYLFSSASAWRTYPKDSSRVQLQSRGPHQTTGAGFDMNE